MQSINVDQLADRWAAMVGNKRIIVGLAGAPGSGKSTIAQAVIERLQAAGICAASVPMDGYHLADVTLDHLGLRARKGAIDTFDGHGYLALLRRLRAETKSTVYAPAFNRDIEQPIAGAIGIGPETQLVVTEGNYLLFSETPWAGVRDLLDEVWFVQLDDDERRSRLHARHEEFGKTPDQARAWVAAVDDANATLIEATAPHATGIVRH